MIKKTCWRAFILAILVVMTGGGLQQISAQAIQDTALIHSYPKLYQTVYQRNAGRLLSYTSDSLPQIRAQAWRALAQTPIDSLSEFISKVKHDGSKQAWFALSMHELAAPQLRDFEQYWNDHPADRAGVSLVLGRQGDEQTLAFLLKHQSEITRKSNEKETALAVSRLMIHFAITPRPQAEVVRTAFSADDAAVTRAWLYGFYRGDKNELNAALKDTLSRLWHTFGVGKSADVDQLVARLLAPDIFSELVHYYHTHDALRNHVSLSIELARSISGISLTPSNREAIKTVLAHPNMHVKQQALQYLSGRLQSGDPLLTFISRQFIDEASTPPLVWLQALETAAETDSSRIAAHADQLNTIEKNYPYLFPRVLQLWRKAENDDAFLTRLQNGVASRNDLKSMEAVNALAQFVNETGDKNRLKSHIRKITFNALDTGDRGVTYATEAVLADSVVFGTHDFRRINGYLKNFSLPGDIEVYQVFGALYKKRFPKQAQPVIDSLAAKNYAPLNRSLKQSGWNVQVPNVKKNFRIPNWQRLWALGRHPVWVLETEKGNIKVRMNTLSAPATVSAIDSLTRAGAYNGVPFHRVVPNFVIQGGDVERQDGFGGPEFVIPTEASEQGFVRGAAGIASAGPDTEGSQYFFMLQRAPHLNGRYTLFGQVVEGMDVVNKIVVGDIVEKAYWE